MTTAYSRHRLQVEAIRHAFADAVDLVCHFTVVHKFIGTRAVIGISTYFILDIPLMTTAIPVQVVEQLCAVCAYCYNPFSIREYLLVHN